MQLFYSMISYWYNESKIDGFSLKIRGLLLFVFLTTTTTSAELKQRNFFIHERAHIGRLFETLGKQKRNKENNDTQAENSLPAELAKIKKKFWFNLRFDCVKDEFCIVVITTTALFNAEGEKRRQLTSLHT